MTRIAVGACLVLLACAGCDDALRAGRRLAVRVLRDRNEAAEPAAASKTRVQLGEVAVEGSLPVERATQVFERYGDDLLACQASSSSLRALELELELAVSAPGAVETATIHPPGSSDAAFERCLIAAAKRWTFPQSAGGPSAIVRYSVRLERK